ncbi:hypothetical protein [uncultured Ruminococcus sp.]|uniref:hypothetical protein n=1 Tax=uncultured Ruminococcus sp. TaxID=165186 RepID=UPI0025F4B0C4|nr:hypothetical protein [uncultured Ruminococcus sp.]
MGAKKGEDLTTIIQTAVTAAFEVANKNIEEKLSKAVELGTKIGAAVGAEVGAKAAVKAVEREKKKMRDKQYDRRYHNTKLLLRNYRQLNEHFKNAIFEIEQAEEYDESFYDIMEIMSDRGYDDDLYVKSIKESSVRTKIIMTHVNRMLDIYGVMCERSNRADDKRHYRILKAMYLDDTPVTATEVANREGVDKRTVYRDIDAAAACLTTLFYGVNGIDNL